MNIYIVPLAIMQSKLGCFMCHHGHPVSDRYREKLFRDLTEVPDTENMSVNKRFFTLENNGSVLKPRVVVSWWFGTIAPARMLVVPKHLADRVAASAWGGVRFHRDTLLGVSFKPLVDEAGVLSTAH